MACGSEGSDAGLGIALGGTLLRGRSFVRAGLRAAATQEIGKLGAGLRKTATQEGGTKSFHVGFIF